jgi:hypothetical protein
MKASTELGLDRPYRRVRIQGDQGRGRLGYRSTVQAYTLIVNSKILLLMTGLLKLKGQVADRFH